MLKIVPHFFMQCKKLRAQSTNPLNLFSLMHGKIDNVEKTICQAKWVVDRNVSLLLTHSCPPFQHLLSERLTSLGIIGAPKVPHYAEGRPVG